MIFEVIEIVPLGLLFFALAVNFYIIKALGKGALNITFISFAFGIFFVLMSLVFLLFVGAGMEHDSFIGSSWWHVIVYLSMLSFIWGGARLREVSKGVSTKMIQVKDYAFFAFLMAVLAIIFLFFRQLEAMLAPKLENEILNSVGIQHFGVFVLALMAASTMFYIKDNWGKLLTASANPILFFLLFVGFQHFWELLTESWKVIKISEDTVENVENVLLVFASVFLTFGLVQVARVVRQQLKGVPKEAVT